MLLWSSTLKDRSFPHAGDVPGLSRAKVHHPTLWPWLKPTRTGVAARPVQVTLWDGLLRRLNDRALLYMGVCCTNSVSRGEEALALLLHDYAKLPGGSTVYGVIAQFVRSECGAACFERCGLWL
jgi:hypothetical protein